MKKRTLVAIILLVTLVSLGVVALLFLDSSTAKLANTLDEIVFLAETGDFEKADEITQTLLEEYEKAETFYLLCIKSTPLEEIKRSLTVLPVFARHKDAVHLSSEATAAASALRHIWETERVMLSNVF